MTDDELIREFTRIDRNENGTSFSVRVIGWENSYTPVSTWKSVATLATDVSDFEAAATIRDILQDEQFFRICTECGLRKPIGWMSGEYCQSCGEQNHGIVH